MKRARERGAAMVESLILIPILILIDAGLIYMHSAYDTRLATMRGARNEGWQYAMGSCEDPGASSSIAGDDSSLGSAFRVLGRARGLSVGRSMTRRLVPNLQVGEATSAKTSKGSDVVDAFRGQTMTTRSRVICNEEPASISGTDKRATVHLLYGAIVQQ